MELESLTDRRRRVEEESKDRQQRTVEARQKLNALRDSLSKQKARKESLEGILSHRAYTTESVKRLFDRPTEGFRPLGVLADFVEVTNPEWERASEEFLHEELEYVVVQDWQDAERGIEVLRAASDGRATFLVHPESGGAAAAAPDLSSEPAVSGTLRDALRLTNGFAAAPQGLLPRLARCFLVADHSAAPRLAEAIPIAIFCCPTAASYHGHTITGGKKSSGGPLALKRELRELTAQVEIRDREADELTAELEALGARLGAFVRRTGAGARACSRHRKKTRWRSTTSSASWPKNTPAPVRASRLPVWNSSAWRDRMSKPAPSANAIKRWSRKRSKPASIRKKPSRSLAANSTDCKLKSTPSAKNIRFCAPTSPDSKNAPARKRLRLRASKPRSLK